MCIDVTTGTSAPEAASNKKAFESTRTRPVALSANANNIPAELTQLAQWVVWRYTWSHKKRKWDKPPTNVRTCKLAASDDPSTWTSFERAHTRYTRQGSAWSGIGFVFAPRDGYCGFDLDDCRDPLTGTISAWAVEFVATIGSYSEVSPSGTGIKGICRAVLPEGKGRKLKLPGGQVVELYDRGRYFTVTGQRLAAAPGTIEDAQAAVDDLLARYGVTETRNAKPPVAARATRPSCRTITLADQEVIAIAEQAANGAKFRRLWAGDTSGHNGDHSVADLALVSILAFYVQGDAGRIDTLFRQSGLYRPKWDRQDYRDGTIRKAVSGRIEFYDPDRHGNPGRTSALLAAERHFEQLVEAGEIKERPAEQVLRANPLVAELAAVGGDGASLTDPPPVLGDSRGVFRRRPSWITCERPVRKYLWDITAGRHVLKTFPCQTYGCTGCSEWHRDRWIETITVRLHQHEKDRGGPVYVFRLGVDDWDRVRFYIRANGGEFFRTPLGESGAYLIVSGVRPANVSGVEQLSADDAAAALCNVVRAIPRLTGQPVFASHGWKLLPLPKRESQLIDLHQHDCHEGSQDKILAAHKASVKCSVDDATRVYTKAFTAPDGAVGKGAAISPLCEQHKLVTAELKETDAEIERDRQALREHRSERQHDQDAKREARRPRSRLKDLYSRRDALKERRRTVRDELRNRLLRIPFIAWFIRELNAKRPLGRPGEDGPGAGGSGEVFKEFFDLDLGGAGASAWGGGWADYGGPPGPHNHAPNDKQDVCDCEAAGSLA